LHPKVTAVLADTYNPAAYSTINKNGNCSDARIMPVTNTAGGRQADPTGLAGSVLHNNANLYWIP